MIRTLLLVAAAALATACPKENLYHGYLNLGVNEGGCMFCSAVEGCKAACGISDTECHNACQSMNAAAVAEMEDSLCRQACLADPDCRAYETAQPSSNNYYSSASPDDVAINCCIEWAAPEDFDARLNWADCCDTAPNCKKEAACWSTCDMSVREYRKIGEVPSACYATDFGRTSVDDARWYMDEGCPIPDETAQADLDAANCRVSDDGSPASSLPGYDDYDVNGRQAAETADLIGTIIPPICICLSLPFVLVFAMKRRRLRELNRANNMAAMASGVTMTTTSTAGFVAAPPTGFGAPATAGGAASMPVAVAMAMPVEGSAGAGAMPVVAAVATPCAAGAANSEMPVAVATVTAVTPVVK